MLKLLWIFIFHKVSSSPLPAHSFLLIIHLPHSAFVSISFLPDVSSQLHPFFHDLLLLFLSCVIIPDHIYFRQTTHPPNISFALVSFLTLYCCTFLHSILCHYWPVNSLYMTHHDVCVAAQALPKVDSGRRKPLAMTSRSNTLPRSGRRTASSSSQSPPASPKTTRSRGNSPLHSANGLSAGKEVGGVWWGGGAWGVWGCLRGDGTWSMRVPELYGCLG